jgi:hypothetical protein
MSHPSPQVSQVGAVPIMSPIEPVFIESSQPTHTMVPTAQPVLPTTADLLSTIPLPILNQTSTHGVLIFDSITLPGPSSVHPSSFPTMATVSAGSSTAGSVSISVSVSVSTSETTSASSESGVGIGSGVVTFQLASPT